MIAVLTVRLISTDHDEKDCPPALCAGGCGTLTSTTHVAGPFGRQTPCCADCFEEEMAYAAEQDAQREYEQWAESHCPDCERSTHPEEIHYGGGCVCCLMPD